MRQRRLAEALGGDDDDRRLLRLVEAAGHSENSPHSEQQPNRLFERLFELGVRSLGGPVVIVGREEDSWILRGVQRAQAQINTESLKMNAFDFTPASPVSRQ